MGDYADSGYARGHMAPAEDMRFSETAEEESNLLSNIAPQNGASFNSSIWKSIENRVRRWTEDRDDLTIICGPVFESREQVSAVERQPSTTRQRLFNVIGSNEVAVPTAFFKIIVDAADSQNPEVLSFLVDHRETMDGPEREVETYLTSVDRIEKLTGLDFLGNLDEGVEQTIESVTARSTF